MPFFPNLKLALFSGKGGVGKTTLSCGFARHWAQQFPTEQVLLLSTDPAHSLGDVLQLSVTDTPQALADCPNLQVRALDAQQLLRSFRSQYGTVLEQLVERGSFVQGSDLTPIWDLGWPGLDELMGILEIQRLLQTSSLDRIVVDMAPSGHSLNLFGLMEFLDRFLDALDLFQENHRQIQQSFTGRYCPDEADRFLTEMRSDLTAGRQLLQDAQQTICMVVAIPEPMSYQETQRFMAALEKLHIPIGGLWINRIINRISPAAPAAQGHLLRQFAQLADPVPVWIVPLQSQDPIGPTEVDRLFNQNQLLTADADDSVPLTGSIDFPTKLPPGLSDLITEGRRLVIVGGKGGVGKTTVAAAIAWGMARQHPEHRVRVVSIDPAHSLADAFGTPLEHQPTALTTNLSAQEVNAHLILEQFREEYLWELAEMMSGENGESQIQLAYTPQAWRQIVAQALPGIDEMLSLVTIMDLLERGDQQLIVLDTAPTGHLLRFLQMPTALGDWLAWIFKLWIKYQDVVGRTELIGRLRTLRQRVMRAQKLLTDPAHTELISVLQAQTAIVAETERLSQALVEMGIYQRYIIHNRYQSGQELPPSAFAAQTIVRLPAFPTAIDPLTQIKGAASLLF